MAAVPAAAQFAGGSSRLILAAAARAPGGGPRRIAGAGNSAPPRDSVQPGLYGRPVPAAAAAGVGGAAPRREARSDPQGGWQPPAGGGELRVEEAELAAAFAGGSGAPAAPPRPAKDSVLKKSLKKAVGGGTAGALAMVLQTCSLMWLRTIMNYQYRYGLSTAEAARRLYEQGGVARFYQGIQWALLQAPLSRFGDTAANSGALALLDSLEATSQLPTAVKTFGASLAAGAWRIVLSPVDAAKTSLQVDGAAGMAKLRAKVAARGPVALYDGALGTFSATAVGHFPWFATYNVLDSNLPKPEGRVGKLVRSAGMGIISAGVSDTVSNSLRVLKTVRQTSETDIGYMEAARQVIDEDGLAGLFGRGLQTKLITNSIQSMAFSVLWRAIEQKITSGKSS
eukprot:TRINITY_DN1766_c3_g1_i1.p1 TRINITY_DN1766_c3_g1~~TRINITY_DN1766_c3_g1_i1.p1  ORF type:complete len:423 (+),score=143.80 TRINITY_DN1766_c3_g1_i1:81-1271(+)